MQIIPQARNNLQKYEEHQFTFGGIEHSAGARDGAIYDMENMALDDAPTLSVRKKRQLMPYDIEGKVYGIGSADKLFWCSGAGGNEAAAEQSFASVENTDSVLASETEDQSTNGALGGDTSSVKHSLTPSPQGEGLNVWFYYDGEEKFPVSATEKTFAVINKYICIFPDKLYYSLWGDEAVNLHGDIALYSSLELLNEAMETNESIKDGDVYAVGLTEPYSFFQYNSKGKWKGATTEDHAKQTRWIYLMDSWGKLDDKVTVPYDLEGTAVDGFKTEKINVDGYGEIACLGLFGGIKGEYAERFAKWIRPGDTVKVTKVKESDGEVVVEYAKFIKKVNSGIDSNKNYSFFAFDPVVVTTASSYSQITIERAVPDLSFAFCHDNRLWGVEKDKIYASKLGDPFNFVDYSTIADASWTVGIASSGPFTGGIAYNGYPTFFKEDRIIRVSGNYPSQYSTYETADVPGVAKGSSKSLAVCNGYLYYLSPEGVCAYSGSYPSVIGEDIGEVLSYGCGGAGGDKYYLEASANEVLAVYVYDTRVRAWLKEEKLEAAGFTDIGRDLYALTEDGIYLLDSEKQTGDTEEDFKSFTEFAPIYDGHLTKKGLSKLHISLEASEGAKVTIYISYDGGEWIKVKEISSSKRQNYNIPLTIRRCGYYRIRIEGKGNYIIYAIGKVRYFGSDM